MTYSRGSLPDGSAKTVIDIIVAQMQADGWTLADTVTDPSIATATWRVMRAADGSNFVAMRENTASTGQFAIACAELFDPATDLASKYCPAGSISPMDSDGTVAGNAKRFGDVAASPHPGIPAQTLPGSGTYYLKTSPRGMMIGINGFNVLTMAGKFPTYHGLGGDKAIYLLNATYNGVVFGYGSQLLGSFNQAFGTTQIGQTSYFATDGVLSSATDVANGNRPYAVPMVITNSGQNGIRLNPDLLHVPGNQPGFDDEFTITRDGVTKTYAVMFPTFNFFTEKV